MWLGQSPAGCHKVCHSCSYNLFPHVLYVSICYVMGFSLIFPAADYFVLVVNENSYKSPHLHFLSSCDLSRNNNVSSKALGEEILGRTLIDPVCTTCTCQNESWRPGLWRGLGHKPWGSNHSHVSHLEW